MMMGPLLDIVCTPTDMVWTQVPREGSQNHIGLSFFRQFFRYNTTHREKTEENWDRISFKNVDALKKRTIPMHVLKTYWCYGPVDFADVWTFFDEIAAQI